MKTMALTIMEMAIMAEIDRGPLSAYEISRDIPFRTMGLLHPSHQLVYSCIDSLLKRRYIEPRDNRIKGKRYRLTQTGVWQLEVETNRLHQFVQTLRRTKMYAK